jgi:hypothetical protein
MPFRCLTSAPRSSQLPVWASSPRSSLWLSACGGLVVPKRLRARPATSTSAERGAALVIDEKTREQATAQTDSPRKLFSHGDDCDRRCDHLTCGGPCARFRVWIVLIDSRCACGNGAAPCATAANFPARQVPCEAIMTQRGWISPIEAMAPASRLVSPVTYGVFARIEIRFFRIPRPSLPIYRDRRQGIAGEGSVGPRSPSPASRKNSR